MEDLVARIAIRTGISPGDLLDTPIPILNAMVAHLTGQSVEVGFDVPLDEIAVPR